MMENTSFLLDDYEPIRYENDPLVEVLCQIRFPPDLKISQGNPVEFQERTQGRFAIYSQVDSPGLSIQFGAFPKEAADALSPRSLSGPYRFESADGEAALSLTPGYLALTKTVYKGWADFVEDLSCGEVALRSVYTIPFYSRVGLRYRDLIQLSDVQAENWEQIIDPSLLGPLADEQLKSAVVTTSSQTIIQFTGVKQYRIQLRHGMKAGEQPGTEVYEIDIDCFTEERTQIDELDDVLEELHRSARNVFRRSITEDLHNALQPKSA